MQLPAQKVIQNEASDVVRTNFNVHGGRVASERKKRVKYEGPLPHGQRHGVREFGAVRRTER